MDYRFKGKWSCILLMTAFLSLTCFTVANADFSFSSPHFEPQGTGPNNNGFSIANTSSALYVLYLDGVSVNDSFSWKFYSPVIDPNTGLATGSQAAYGTGMWVYQGDKWMWWAGFFPDYWYNPYNNGYFGAGVYPSGAARGLPGEWLVEVYRNSGGIETCLISANFYLIDDVKPTVTFISPVDGGNIKPRQDVSISATDNVKVTYVEVTIFNKETGQSVSITDLKTPGRDGNYSFTWSTRKLPLGEYVIYAKAYDPYGNWNDVSVEVTSSPEVGIVAIKAEDSLEVPLHTNPVYMSDFLPSCDVSSATQLPILENPNDSFSLVVTLDACPVKPGWEPLVEWDCSVLDYNSPPDSSFTGWTGTIPVLTTINGSITDRTFGDHKLTLNYKIKDPNTLNILKRGTILLTVRIVPKIIPITMGLTKQLTATPDSTGSALVVEEGAANSGLKWSILSGDNGQVSSTGLFRAIYISRPYRMCFVKVTDGTNTGYAVMDVKRPDSLGNAPNEYDNLIIDTCDRFGVPPQWTKAQMQVESSFNQNSYRYEPKYDWGTISGTGYGWNRTSMLEVAPYKYYRLAAPAENSHGALAQGTLLNPSDISPRNKYSLVDSNSNGYYSAWEIISANPSQWWRADMKPPTTIDFTAQTTISSSYGLLQIMWPTALLYGWNGGTGGQPHLLFDPSLNTGLSVGYLKKIYIDTGNWETDWKAALIDYNGDPSYGDRVYKYIGNYTPTPAY